MNPGSLKIFLRLLLACSCCLVLIACLFAARDLAGTSGFFILNVIVGCLVAFLLKGLFTRQTSAMLAVSGVCAVSWFVGFLVYTPLESKCYDRSSLFSCSNSIEDGINTALWVVREIPSTIATRFFDLVVNALFAITLGLLGAFLFWAFIEPRMKS